MYKQTGINKFVTTYDTSWSGDVMFESFLAGWTRRCQNDNIYGTASGENFVKAMPFSLQLMNELTLNLMKNNQWIINKCTHFGNKYLFA